MARLYGLSAYELVLENIHHIVSYVLVSSLPYETITRSIAFLQQILVGYTFADMIKLCPSAIFAELVGVASSVMCAISRHTVNTTHSHHHTHCTAHTYPTHQHTNTPQLATQHAYLFFCFSLCVSPLTFFSLFSFSSFFCFCSLFMFFFSDVFLFFSLPYEVFLPQSFILFCILSCTLFIFLRSIGLFCGDVYFLSVVCSFLLSGGGHEVFWWKQEQW